MPTGGQSEAETSLEDLTDHGEEWEFACRCGQHCTSSETPSDAWPQGALFQCKGALKWGGVVRANTRVHTYISCSVCYATRSVFLRITPNTNARLRDVGPHAVPVRQGPRAAPRLLLRLPRHAPRLGRGRGAGAAGRGKAPPARAHGAADPAPLAVRVIMQMRGCACLAVFGWMGRAPFSTQFT